MPPKMLLTLAWKSLLFRRGSVLLSIAAISVSVFVLLGIEQIRQATKASFNSTISGVDLIVGARTSDLNLLLTTVFRVGTPSQNISWESYQRLLANEKVAWAIPISLGDSHKGFRVVGTDEQFFNHYQYGQGRPLAFYNGSAFADAYDVVIGAEVARRLNYGLGQSIVISHGIARNTFNQHDDKPFTVVGILETTGTPIDNALYVSLASLEAIHSGWRGGVKSTSAPGAAAGAPDDVQPESITAALVGLTSKLATFQVQRNINTSTEEPLTAILPGVALMQLWQISGTLERALSLVASLVLATSLLGLSAMLLATLRERRYEIAVLRSLGAAAWMVFLLIQTEVLVVTLLSAALGTTALLVATGLASDVVAAQYGIDLSLNLAFSCNIRILLYVLAGAALVGLIPATASYFRSRSAPMS